MNADLAPIVDTEAPDAKTYAWRTAHPAPSGLTGSTPGETRSGAVDVGGLPAAEVEVADLCTHDTNPMSSPMME